MCECCHRRRGVVTYVFATIKADLELCLECSHLFESFAGQIHYTG